MIRQASHPQAAETPRPAGEWRNFARVYGQLRPPLRPTPGDVAQVASAIAGRDDKLLLLGVTPELSVLGRHLTAVDNSPRMLETVWIGDRAERRALLGDWNKLPFADSSFTAVIGDGSLNSAPGILREILGELRRVLAGGGRAVFRAFCSPDAAESLSAIRSDVANGWDGNVHALKWRIAMVLAASEPDGIVHVRDILRAFDDLFPDRSELAAMTRWSGEEISTLDAYADATHSLGFPTLARLVEIAAPYFANAEVMQPAGYPLAERCPTFVLSAG